MVPNRQLWWLISDHLRFAPPQAVPVLAAAVGVSVMEMLLTVMTAAVFLALAAVVAVAVVAVRAAAVRRGGAAAAAVGGGHGHAAERGERCLGEILTTWAKSLLFVPLLILSLRIKLTL